MTTLTVMKARVASEIARADLTTQIANAITTAISAYQGERFRFSDVTPSAPPTFNTVANQWVYTSADNANISTVFGIDNVFAQIGNALSDLTRDTPANIRMANQLGTLHGMPMSYAYEGNQLLISPVPDGAYPITLSLFRSVAAPASDDEANNPWMTDGELLIRSRAKYEIALHVTRNVAMQEAMSPMSPPPGKTTGHAAYHAWKELKAEANRITGRGRVKAMAF